MFGLRKLIITSMAILTLGISPAFMNDALAKGGKGGGKGGHSARHGHSRHGHNHNRHRNRHGRHRHRHNHRYGRHWYNGRGYFDGGVDGGGDGGVVGGSSEVVIYQVFSRPSGTAPWRLAGSFASLDEAQEEADALRSEGLQAMVE
jgi:hypothetical protein